MFEISSFGYSISYYNVLSAIQTINDHIIVPDYFTPSLN
jgi:hypothetical protein